MMNDPNRQNFGVCEFVILPELPCVCFVQTGSTTNIANVAPGGILLPLPKPWQRFRH